MNKLMIVDGHSLACRVYFACNREPVTDRATTRSGKPITTTFGFLRSLFGYIKHFESNGLLVAFDSGSPSFRSELFPEYKTGRTKKTDDFLSDLEMIKESLALLKIPVIVSPVGFEADDVIASVVQGSLDYWDWEIDILSSDMDLFQLVKESINVIRPQSTGQKERCGTQEVKSSVGVYPSQIIEYKALCGDKSDCLPGVKGIGKKKAISLLESYGNLGQIYYSLDEMTPKVREMLVAGKESAMLCKKLATLITTVPLGIDLESCRFSLDSHPEMGEIERMIVNN